eukprot:4915983-Pyramimonas_sp.AAC.1
MAYSVCTPCGLGSAGSGVKHKMHCLLHQHFLECGWERCVQTLNSTVSFTTDFGDEHYLATAKPFKISAFFNWARTSDFNPEDGVGSRGVGGMP